MGAVERHLGASGTTFRAAVGGDCRRIAELVRIASEGVTDYLWSTLAPEYPGMALIEVGAIRYSDEESVFSYKNCVVAEHDGEVIGLLLSFPVEVESGASSGEPVDPVLEPYSMEVPGSFYICSLAVLPESRGLGIGRKMLDIARERARERGLDTLSLLVFEQNQGACRLYEREGFALVDRAQVVPHELIHYTGDVLLMAAEARRNGMAEQPRRREP